MGCRFKAVCLSLSDYLVILKLEGIGKRSEAVGVEMVASCCAISRFQRAHSLDRPPQNSYYPISLEGVDFFFN